MAMTVFKEATDQVYGDISASNWTPPSLSSSSSRHLYTDANAVINFITLAKLTPSFSTSPPEIRAAQVLIHSVHDILGRTQDGSRRLNVASDEEPLKGGLRDGSLVVGGGEPDGQSHGALMLWIFALNRYAIYTKDQTYIDLAIQLAKAIFPHFVKEVNGSYKIYAKLSAEITDGPVKEESNYLDPYDGYTILSLLSKSAEDSLTTEVQAYESVLTSSAADASPFSSKDPSEIGQALWISHFYKDSNESIRKLCQGAFSSLMALQRTRYFSKELEDRVPFGEFVTAMGIRCFDYSKSSAVFEGIADNITLAWGGPGGVLDDENPQRRARDLVAYAAALQPGAFKDDFFLES